MEYKTLADLPLEQTAFIEHLAFEGEFQRRLLDLGFSTGNTVTALFQSPFGDPTAYMIMGSIIALRREDANQIAICAFKEVL